LFVVREVLEGNCLHPENRVQVTNSQLDSGVGSWRSETQDWTSGSSPNDPGGFQTSQRGRASGLAVPDPPDPQHAANVENQRAPTHLAHRTLLSRRGTRVNPAGHVDYRPQGAFPGWGECGCRPAPRLGGGTQDDGSVVQTHCRHRHIGRHNAAPVAPYRRQENGPARAYSFVGGTPSPEGTWPSNATKFCGTQIGGVRGLGADRSPPFSSGLLGASARRSFGLPSGSPSHPRTRAKDKWWSSRAVFGVQWPNPHQEKRRLASLLICNEPEPLCLPRQPREELRPPSFLAKGRILIDSPQPRRPGEPAAAGANFRWGISDCTRP